MLNRIREPFGKAGLIVAIIALVFAMLGGAYAASKSSGGGKATASAKAKKGPRGPKGPKGDTGPAGPQGAKGDQGPKGDTGANGKDGTNGTNGTNGTDGEAGMCSEEEPECVLPEGATLTGTYSIAFTSNEKGLVSISLPLHTATPPVALYGRSFGAESIGIQLQNPGEGQFASDPEAPNSSISVYGTSSSTVNGVFVELPQAVAAWEEKCPGSFDEPEAASGFLCIYPGPHEGDPEQMERPNVYSANTEAPHDFGVTTPMAGAPVGSTSEIGSWAVTG